MSGFAGIINSDGRPPDERLIRRMTESLTSRGPDAQAVWVGGSAALGHTLLRTTVEGEHEEQPATVDGAAWIVADARVDGRSSLIAALERHGHRGLRPASDAHLLLHAYLAWGERCVDHLLGDFSFAIWDPARRRLFCARDHFGIKPFYYACVDGGIVFSNTLECVRRHPRVRAELNELAIADFLLFGSNLHLTATAFADINRLPAAHYLEWEPGATQSTRYWVPPTGGRIRYARGEDYVAHFQQVLQSAVSDRLRTTSVAVWMSGGLDSTALTAAAKRVASDGGAALDLRAHTIVYDSLIPDCERRYAAQAAAALGVDITFFPADDYLPFEGWDRADLRMPEPTADAFLFLQKRLLEWTAQHGRVLLSGIGGDEVLWPSYVVDVVHRMRPLEVIRAVSHTIASRGPRPGIGARARLRKWVGRDPHAPVFPAWLNCELVDRLELKTRWEAVLAATVERAHPLRPEAHRRLAGVPWPWYFESFDPGATGVAVECRYPFLDIRVIEYLLAIPPFPWCVDKQLLRVSLRDVLPDALLMRPKTALAGNPLTAHVRKSNSELLPRFTPVPELGRFLDCARIPPLTGADTPNDVDMHIRPLCLNYWLSRVRSQTAS